LDILFYFTFLTITIINVWLYSVVYPVVEPKTFLSVKLRGSFRLPHQSTASSPAPVWVTHIINQSVDG